MNNTDNEQIRNKINELAEMAPEEKYNEQTEAEDPEMLEQARKKLMLVINVKCKGIGQDVIAGQIKPMVYQMNIADCESMAQLIKKKGMYGLPLVLKTRTKHIG